MTTRRQKRKAAEELVSTEIETPLPEISQNEYPVAGTSKSPRVISENLEDIKTTLRKEILADLTRILVENQKEMLKLIAPVTKKQAIIRTSEEADSDSENIPENVTSTPIKTKELFEDLFRNNIKMYPHLTEIQKINYFHSLLRGNALQAYCNLDDTKKDNLEEVITAFKRRFEDFQSSAKQDANGTRCILTQPNKNYMNFWTFYKKQPKKRSVQRRKNS